MLCILSIVRNYPVGYSQIVKGGWDLAEVSNKAYDIEGKVVGIVGGGRIGQLVMHRLKVGSSPLSLNQDSVLLSQASCEATFARLG